MRDAYLTAHINRCHPNWTHTETATSVEPEEPAVKRQRHSQSDLSRRPPHTGYFFQNHDPVHDPEQELDTSEEETPEDHRIEIFPDAGQPVSHDPNEVADHQGNLHDPWFPFTNEQQYRCAEWAVRHRIPFNAIDEALKSGFFTSAITNGMESSHKFRNWADFMDDGLSKSWRRGTLECGWNDEHPKRIEFVCRDIMECVKWLLRQPAHKDHLVYAPVREFDDQGRRRYHDMHTADWWWNVQVSRSPHCQRRLS
jgi:hypothetical protein